MVCAPFFHAFLGRESELCDVEFVDSPPSVQSAGLMDGSIHLSPASSITFALKPGAFVLSPVFCTSCSFEVRSVKLFSRYPIESLAGRHVRVTSQSRTSVALLRILFEMRYGIRPEYVGGLAACSSVTSPSRRTSAGVSHTVTTWARSGRNGRGSRSCSEPGLFRKVPCRPRSAPCSTVTCSRRNRAFSLSVPT